MNAERSVSGSALSLVAATAAARVLTLLYGVRGP